VNFLVTGGAGFIGSHVCERLLLAGHSVWAFDDLNDFYDPRLKQANLRDLQALAKPFEFIHGDLVDKQAVEALTGSIRFDQIIHLGARAGVRPSLQDPVLYQRVNVEGTINLLEGARKHGIKKLILASSSSVYGVNSKVPFSEGDPIFHPISPYAASKLACSARPRLSPRVWYGHRHVAVFYRVWPTPAARSGDPKVRRVDSERQTHTRFWGWVNRSGLYLHFGHNPGRDGLHGEGVWVRRVQSW
jgi:nucleoside-diphosphate-sugar epimerase